jgi:hypothetical protein
MGARLWHHAPERAGNQVHQCGPWYHEVHLVEELALARPLRLAFESSAAQAHLFHGFN